MSEKVSILLLDYAKPNESKLCLNSIKKHCEFDYELVYLSNGGPQDYVIDFYKEGLIDRLVLNKNNSGCGNGMELLYHNSECKYCIMVQNDQEFISDITKTHINHFIHVIEREKYGYVDLAGAQAGINNYSDRAGFFARDLYLSIYKGERGFIGGAGPYNNLIYSERYIQDYFKKNNIKIAHFNGFIKDNGYWSIREIGDGIYRHRCDTKILQVLKTPTYATEEYPPLQNFEWDLMLSGGWPKEGKIPEKWKEHSFVVEAWKDKL